MAKKELPQVTKQDFLGRKGVRMVETAVAYQLGWIFREQPINDLGIDGQVEILDSRQRGTGRLIAVQIKCGESFFSEQSERGVVYRGAAKHLSYWLDHSLPVVVVLCSPSTGKCIWQEVGSANAEPLEKGWKIEIPNGNELSASAKDQLVRIAGRPQHRDIVEVLLYRHLHEKYIGRIQICTLFEQPRDYWMYAYLAKIDGVQTMIHFHYDDTGLIVRENIDAIIEAKAYNDKVCGPNPLHIYVVSRSKRALQLAPDLRTWITTVGRDVRVFTVLYHPAPSPDLTEVDQSGRPVEFWPDSIY
jgi:hypothetical protein